VSVARRNLKEADPPGPGYRRTGIGSKAVVRGERALDRNAPCSIGRTPVDPAGTRPSKRHLPWEISVAARDGPSQLPVGTRREGAEKSAEAIVVRVVGEAREALQSRKAESTDRPSRERRTKGGTRWTKEQSELTRWA